MISDILYRPPIHVGRTRFRPPRLRLPSGGSGSRLACARLAGIAPAMRSSRAAPSSPERKGLSRPILKMKAHVPVQRIANVVAHQCDQAPQPCSSRQQAVEVVFVQRAEHDAELALPLPSPRACHGALAQKPPARRSGRVANALPRATPAIRPRTPRSRLATRRSATTIAVNPSQLRG